MGYLVVFLKVKSSVNLFNMLEFGTQNIVNKAFKFKSPDSDGGLFLLRVSFQCTGECCESFDFLRWMQGSDLSFSDRFFGLSNRGFSYPSLRLAARGNHLLRCRYD